MATQLTIVNKVLQRLRESTVSSVAANSYAVLIAMFLNDAKEDLEDMWFWTVNEISIDMTVTADGTRQYALDDTTDRSFLIRYIEDRQPMAYDVTVGEQHSVQDIPYKELLDYRANFKGTVPTVAVPHLFAIRPASDGRGYRILLREGANTERLWRTHWYKPQAELALNGDDNSTEILLPERPIYLRTLYYALNERGEEMGEPGNVAEQRAERAAAAAMEIDTQVHKKSDEKDMTNLERLRTSMLGEFI